MAVVKFSILTLLAGGFCTLLGIGMWMGPQEAPCNAQTDAAVVAVADSPAPIKSCWSQPSHVPFGIDLVSSESDCVSTCGGGALTASPASSESCQSGACDLVATTAPAEPNAYPTSPPSDAVVPRMPAATYGAYVPSGPCDSGVCAPGVPYPTGAPCLPGTVCPPGAPCLPPPSFATTSYYHVAPVAGLECPPPAYPNTYGIAPAYASPAPVVSAYASYREEPRTSDQPSMEMIEAFMEEREKRYEAQIEAMKAMTELKIEAQEALLKAEHQVALTQFKAEAMVKFATMEQALREEKALLQLVADGTLTTDALRAIIAKNHANGHGSPVQPVSTAAGCACEKCGCETCKCGQPEAACACSKCECEGCACPGCEQAVSTVAPTCPACKASACEISACETKACETSTSTASACGKSGDCKSCDATTVVSVEACEACAKSCDACVKACGDCKLGDATLECNQLTLSADGKTCTIVVGCPNGECKASECEKSVAVEAFVCEKDGCEVQFHVSDEVPFLSNIPYLGRLFQNVKFTEATSEESVPVEEAQR